MQLRPSRRPADHHSKPVADEARKQCLTRLALVRLHQSALPFDALTFDGVVDAGVLGDEIANSVCGAIQELGKAESATPSC